MLLSSRGGAPSRAGDQLRVACLAGAFHHTGGEAAEQRSCNTGLDFRVLSFIKTYQKKKKNLKISLLLCASTAAPFAGKCECIAAAPSASISGCPGMRRLLCVGVLPVRPFPRHGRPGILPCDCGCAAIDLAVPPL